MVKKSWLAVTKNNDTLLILTNFCIGYSAVASLFRLIHSLRYIEDHGIAYNLLLCIQGKKSEFEIPPHVRRKVSATVHSESKSISSARNQLIEYCMATYPTSSRVLFLDDDCFITAPAASIIASWLKRISISAILMGRPPWGIPLPFRATQPIASSWLWQGYVWTTVFPLSAFIGVRFDESIGPGSGSERRAGEDFSFMLDIVRKNKDIKILFCYKFMIGHPPRSDMLSKQLEYARGHAYVLTRALFRQKNLYMTLVAWTYLAAFISRPMLNLAKNPNQGALVLVRRRIAALYMESVTAIVHER